MKKLICALMLLGLVSVVGAHSGNSDPNVVHACVRRDKLTKIVSPTSSCAKGDRSKHWSIEGPAGPQGPQGPAGPQGQGPAGPSGEYVLYDGNTRIGPALEVRSTSVLIFHEKLGVELRVSPNGQVFATGGSYNLWYLEANCAGTAHVFKNDITKDYFLPVINSFQGGSNPFWYSLSTEEVHTQPVSFPYGNGCMNMSQVSSGNQIPGDRTY